MDVVLFFLKNDHQVPVSLAVDGDQGPLPSQWGFFKPSPDIVEEHGDDVALFLRSAVSHELRNLRGR